MCLDAATLRDLTIGVDRHDPLVLDQRGLGRLKLALIVMQFGKQAGLTLVQVGINPRLLGQVGAFEGAQIVLQLVALLAQLGNFRFQLQLGGGMRQALGDPVSYTHLTLPTILLV